MFWGDPNFKVAWPTVLSAIKDPTTRLASGRLGESLAVGDFNGDGTFTARSARIDFTSVSGRWAVDDAHVITAAVRR